MRTDGGMTAEGDTSSSAFVPLSRHEAFLMKSLNLSSPQSLTSYAVPLQNIFFPGPPIDMFISRGVIDTRFPCNHISDRQSARPTYFSLMYLITIRIQICFRPPLSLLGLVDELR